MTLSPVFRSAEAVALLRSEGVWDRLADASAGQAEAVSRVAADLPHVIDERFVRGGSAVPEPSGGEVPPESTEDDALSFLQQFFFLVLFRSVLESLDVDRASLDFYSEVNYCIKGTVMAADDLFDEQTRSFLPLDVGSGARFGSVLRLLCFSRLLDRVFERRVASGALTRWEGQAVQKELLSRMADIGVLEGSEEGGIRDTLEPEEMIRAVHRLRGGALFELGFVAPRRLEVGRTGRKVTEAVDAIVHLGTAFQIVDDVTDFESDLRRGSHNLLVSQIHHHGDASERAALGRVRAGVFPARGAVEEWFVASGGAVLEYAHAEAHAGLERLNRLGFWMEPRLADELVRAIVGMDGVARMRAVAGDP